MSAEETHTKVIHVLIYTNILVQQHVLGILARSQLLYQGHVRLADSQPAGSELPRPVFYKAQEYQAEQITQEEVVADVEETK